MEGWASGKYLVSRIANVRCALALASLLVIILDHTVPLKGTEQAMMEAMAGSGTFMLYAVVLRLLIHFDRIHLATFETLSPFLDIVFASVLIVATNGYLSPFTLWFVFAVVTSGFSPNGQLPIAATAVALIAHILIATIPQDRPLDEVVFLVRTVYLFGFATTVAGLGSYLARQARAIQTIEKLGARSAHSNDREHSLQLFLEAVQAAFRVEGVAIDHQGWTRSWGTCSGEPKADYRVPSEGIESGRLSLYRSTRFSSDEDQSIRILVDRLAATLRRHDLTDRLIANAGAEERLRLADQLHDGFIQTLAAIDMRAEVANELVGSDAQATRTELSEIKNLARHAAAEARGFLLPLTQSDPDLPEFLGKVRARWKGEFEVSMDPSITLSEDQTIVTKALLKEGVANASRHGKATSVRFTVQIRHEALEIALEADGQPPKLPIKPGYGLSRLDRIVDDVGGVWRLVPRSGGGSVLTATLPIHREVGV